MVDLTGGVLLEVTGSTETWFYPNLEGGTAAEASSTGAAVGGITLYDPFGNALTSLQSDSPDGLAYGFEGKHGIGTDIDAGGIVLMGARLYSPTTGRFLQADPVFGGSCNSYDYTCQDPLNASDLSGDVSWSITNKAVKGCISIFFALTAQWMNACGVSNDDASDWVLDRNVEAEWEGLAETRAAERNIIAPENMLELEPLETVIQVVVDEQLTEVSAIGEEEQAGDFIAAERAEATLTGQENEVQIAVDTFANELGADIPWWAEGTIEDPDDFDGGGGEGAGGDG